jgi:hypothetical protein
MTVDLLQATAGTMPLAGLWSASGACLVLGTEGAPVSYPWEVISLPGYQTLSAKDEDEDEDEDGFFGDDEDDEDFDDYDDPDFLDDEDEDLEEETEEDDEL